MKMHRIKNKKRKNGGFSLIELVVAMVLLAVVMGGAYSLISQSAVMARIARNHYVAVTLAQNRLERARNFAYDDLPLLAENAVVCDENGSPAPLGSFRRTTAIDSTYTTNTTEIVVTVEIKSLRSGNFDRQEQVASVFTEYLEF